MQPMFEELSKLWPILSMMVGALAAYYGARNAMQERLARLEATQDAQRGEIDEVRRRVDDAHDRLNRYLERK